MTGLYLIHKERICCIVLLHISLLTVKNSHKFWSTSWVSYGKSIIQIKINFLNLYPRLQNIWLYSMFDQICIHSYNQYKHNKTTSIIIMPGSLWFFCLFLWWSHLPWKFSNQINEQKSLYKTVIILHHQC